MWRSGYSLITGGAGFIGTNLADRILRSGKRVLILDNFARNGVEENARWLLKTHGDLVRVIKADIRSRAALFEAVKGSDQIFHLAAQVAVTKSLTDPLEDFKVNLWGTIQLLEAIRTAGKKPGLIYTSTNKVYGNLERVEVRSNGSRYNPVRRSIAANGINEEQPLCFCSPYGCSKGASDQYVLDYSRTFDFRAVVFRMSCIYGPHQFGTEDQGWVAHFLIRSMAGKPITVYGDGLQVRDVLYVDDLVNAMLLAQARMDALRGEAFNIGGGPARTTSLMELIDRIETLRGKRPSLRFSGWREGDQKYYVSDTRKFREASGWAPRTGVEEGIALLHEWLHSNRVQASFTPAKKELMPVGASTGAENRVGPVSPSLQA